ncbi:hypothetical protein Tco_0757529 [Tanacetum coccineum]
MGCNKGNNVCRALVNVPIFVGTFFVVTDFAVLEDMDAYRDEVMGNVIVGEPFLREVEIKAKRFERIITLYKSDDEITYQIVRSHSRFKRHTNEQCNRIPPLLKVSEKDEKNGISYRQKIKIGGIMGLAAVGPAVLLALSVLYLVRLWNAKGEIPQKVPSNAWYIIPLASINCAIHKIIHVENLP